MKMKMKKRGFYIAFSVFVVLLLISLASADLFDFFKKITGKAGEQPQAISIKVRGKDPAQIIYVDAESLAGASPLDGTYRTLTFEAHMYDKNGVSDLNHTSVNATFVPLSGGDSRYSGLPGSCLYKNNINTKTANYSCSIDMWYWDSAGTWQIIVYGTDLGNKTWQFNDSATFSYQQLKAMTLFPTEVTWPDIVPGEDNQTALNYTIINNTGNYNGDIYINGTDLVGVEDSGESITADNFSIGTSTGGASCPGTCPECAGTTLSSSQFTSIITVERGNLSSGNGQNNFYYCIPRVPLVLSQDYNTATGGAWTISYRD